MGDQALSWFTTTTNGILSVMMDSVMKKHKWFADNYSVRHLDIPMGGTQLITPSTVGPRQPISVGEAAPIIYFLTIWHVLDRRLVCLNVDTEDITNITVRIAKMPGLFVINF